ncbi:MAG TPA: sugar phosphate isomerase [Verrucomicrobia bacterium]|nr:sugar phosphate isomerase [Verrucomicrobiota bacterium]
MQTGTRQYLTYCLNVHPGEKWSENFEAIRTKALNVRDRVCPDAHFGLGLRLSNAAALTLSYPVQLHAFRDFLAANRLYAFTINGFPYGAFHQSCVKESVYQPDWRTPERVAYTCRLADILAALLPEGMEGSISTVPGSYKAWIRGEADIEAMARNLDTVARHLAQLRERTGRFIHLGLEPEPDCFLETTGECIDFFERYLLDRSPVIRDHVGVCVDTCHLALQFEDPVASLHRLVQSGIRVSKIQLSAALSLVSEQAVPDQLTPFCDAVYLHQVRVRDGAGRVQAWPDLPDALAAGAESGSEWRVHFHVPLDFAAQGMLRSTATLLPPSFFAAVHQAGVAHLEIETYTFDVLPEALRARGVEASIAAEYAWVLSRLIG